MGKKSKAKAAKSGGSSAATGTSLAIVPAASSGGGGFGRKNVRCFNCRATVKISEGKGHQCAGCSEIYCWRCESKTFAACPNGDDCVCLIRRCWDCVRGSTMVKACKELGFNDDSTRSRVNFPDNEITAFVKIAENSEKLSLDAIPSYCCDCSDTCGALECAKCFSDPNVRGLLRCSDCFKVSCQLCSKTEAITMMEIVTPKAKAISLLPDGEKEEAENQLRGEMKQFFSHVMIMCASCDRSTCWSCSSVRMMDNVSKTTHNGRMAGSLIEFGTQHCDTCYYSKKPCTNPTCPNPIGVPTKRCGGCHISRYCSVECQAMAYPDHQTKCERMQVKLAARKEETA